MARFGLSSPDASVRLEAVRDIEQNLDDANVDLLRERSGIETDPRVKKELSTGLALVALKSSDAQERLAAVSTLRGSIRQDVRNELDTLLQQAPDGSFSEPDERVRQAAAAAVKSIDQWRGFYSGIETLFFGLSLGSVLVLVAIGLAITFGVMGVINMAHGELMMLGAYTTYVVQVSMPGHKEISILVAIPVAFVVAGLMGILIERTVIRFLYGRPLETLLATFGVSLILQQLVRSIFSALNRSVETPQWMSGSLQINDALAITYNRLYIVIFTLLVFGALLLVLKRTRIGLDIRAVSQNRAMARAMGIRSAWVDAITFGLGSGIAGVAGVALSQLTNVGPNLGQSYIIDSFMVVVFGGVGSLWGSMIGGMSMGVVNKLLEPYSGAVLAKILVLVALVLFIQTHPRGLFSAVRALSGEPVIMPPSTLLGLVRKDRGGKWLLCGLVLVAIVVPILNQVVPASSAFHLSAYGLTLIGKYLCYAMLALAVDLIWGYCGILSLGHAAFFSLGGYAMGMYLMRQIGPRGVYGNPILPDFMVFLNWKELPWFWYGFNHFWIAMVMMLLVPGLLALAFGWFAFRSRVTGVYLSIITQALSYALMLAFFRNDMGFGGNNGFTDFKEILGFDLHSDGVRVVLVLTTAVALAAGYLACRMIVESRAGRVMRAIRDAESRTRFLGYPVESFKLWVFAFSAVLAGIAGALYVPQIGIINPSEFAPINSIEVVIWVAVGGRGTLYGAAAGALLVNYAKTYFTSSSSGSLAVRAGYFVCAGDVVPAARDHRTLAGQERGWAGTEGEAAHSGR